LAVKKLSADLNSKNIFLFKQEAELMSKMRHPNILLYISSCLEPPNMYIVTEFMARGSLHSVLNDPTIPLSWYMRVRMALDCASAMLYLHSSEPCIVHRDLKAENLLVSDSWNVKVCDFGLTRFSAQVDSSRGGFSSSSGMTSNIGSTRYCAPEVLGHRGKHVRGFTMNMLSEFSGLLVRRLFTCPQVPYTNSVDVHSFGMILYELAHRGKRPYWQVTCIELLFFCEVSC
jgi:serine/threonine protein kinase